MGNGTASVPYDRTSTHPQYFPGSGAIPSELLFYYIRVARIACRSEDLKRGDGKT
jgi:hypothetical protein